jgi:hypothetical protein
MSSPGRTPSVSEYGHGGSASRVGAPSRSCLLRDTWNLRQWLVVEVLIGILEVHDIAMEGDVDREVFGIWYFDRATCSVELDVIEIGVLKSVCPSTRNEQLHMILHYKNTLLYVSGKWYS